MMKIWDKPVLNVQILPFLHSDGFFKPTLKAPCTFVWFPGKVYFLFPISDFIGGMSKLNERDWLETVGFFNSTGKNTELIYKGKIPIVLHILVDQWKPVLQLCHN